jgi:hypothetical protein
MLVQTPLHEFSMGDNDDPDIYVAAPIYEWQQTEAGRWCMENCEPESITYQYGANPYNFGYRVTISGMLREDLATYFNLKYKQFGKS